MTNQIEQIKTLYCHDFASFISFAFREVFPEKSYIHNWHVEVLADYIARCARGEIKRLIINAPPRSLKSFCASIALPAWLLGKYPNMEILCTHSSSNLMTDLEDKTKKLMQSDRYRSLFPSTDIIKNQKNITLSHGRSRKAVTTSKDLTGIGANMIIIDDALSAGKAQDQASRDKVNKWYDANIYQRLNSKSDASIIVVMQRLHDEDLTKYLLQKNEKWTVLNLPAIADNDESWELSNGRVYYRKKYEALNPNMESHEQLQECLHHVGYYNFAMQYQQGTYNLANSYNGYYNMFVPTNKNPNRPTGIYKISVSKVMLNKIFGIGKNPLVVPPEDLYTDEEFQAMAMAQQERLIAESRRID